MKPKFIAFSVVACGAFVIGASVLMASHTNGGLSLGDLPEPASPSFSYSLKFQDFYEPLDSHILADLPLQSDECIEMDFQYPSAWTAYSDLDTLLRFTDGRSEENQTKDTITCRFALFSGVSNPTFSLTWRHYPTKGEGGVNSTYTFSPSALTYGDATVSFVDQHDPDYLIVAFSFASYSRITFSEFTINYNCMA